MAGLQAQGCFRNCSWLTAEESLLLIRVDLGLSRAIRLLSDGRLGGDAGAILFDTRYMAGRHRRALEKAAGYNEREYTGSGTRHSWGLQIDDLHDHQSAGSVGALDWQVGLQVMR